MLIADLVILGSGPEGMAAPARAVGLGLSVLILDEQPRACGQIYRDVVRASPLKIAMSGTDYAEGVTLTRRCCTTLTVDDSHWESMRLDKPHEQAITRPLPLHELVQLYCLAEGA